ncbi:hypothetical protein EDD21DRAFT_420527 [Dissophora ornata]|nr:hypothetical protein EDD21DRAFT_420527 [Dissophora ornata]
MKFSATALLISVALATVATAAPLIAQENPNTNAHVFTKRCAECTHVDDAAFELFIKFSADHYSDIAHARLNNLMSEIESAKVTSGSRDMQQEKAALTVTVQTKIDEAKKACTSEALASVIKATVMSDASYDMPWSQKEEVEKKMVGLDIMITNLVTGLIQDNINAEMLTSTGSRACSGPC